MSLPDTWVTASINELFDTVGGGTPSTAKAEYWSGSIPWISSADIGGNHQLSVRRFITEAAVRESATNMVPAGSVIVVTRVGLGKVAVAPRELCFSQDSQALLFSSKHFNPTYVLLYMSTAVKVFKHIGRGTTINGVTKKQLLELEFVLPPRNEQDRIVAELEKQFTRLDDAVAALVRVQANLRRYRASVLKAACEGHLVPTEADLARKEGRSYEPASELLKCILAEHRAKWEAEQLLKMTAAGKLPKSDDWKQRYAVPLLPEQQEPFEIPEGWTWTGLDQVVAHEANALKAGPFGSALKKEFYVPQGYKIYGQEQVIRGDAYFGDYYINEERFQTLRSCAIRPGDVLISLVGTAGKILILPQDSQPGIINPRLIKISLNQAVMSARYFKLLMESTHAQLFFKLHAHGETMDVLNLSTLRKFPIPLPPRAEQDRITKEVEHQLSISSVVENDMGKRNKIASRLRRAMLMQAFSGKLVPQDPNDEPASVLLERIRAERAALATNNGNQKATPKTGTANGQRRRRTEKLAQGVSPGKG